MGMKKLFVVSDIHGHASLLKRVLEGEGFDNENPDHLFVGCGDYFDRGSENRQVLEFLLSLKHKVLVRGNHEDMLLQLLRRRMLKEHDYWNGTDITIREFFGPDAIGAHDCIQKNRKAEAQLQAFVDSTVDFFETAHCVFTHGWLPVCPELSREEWLAQWRVQPKYKWEDARFTSWTDVFDTGWILPDKTIICGHRYTGEASLLDPKRKNGDCSPYMGKGFVAIDACTAVTRKMNILVIEDSLCSPVQHSFRMSTQRLQGFSSGGSHYLLLTHTQARPGDKMELTDGKTGLNTKVAGVYSYDIAAFLEGEFTARQLGLEKMSKANIEKKLEAMVKKDGKVTVLKLLR